MGRPTQISRQGQRTVLQLAVDDFTPLFKVMDAIRDETERTGDAGIATAAALVRRLLQRGYAKAYYDCLFTADRPERCAIELSPAELDAELADPANWSYHPRREPDDRWVSIAATDEGEAAMFAGEFALD